MYPKWRSTRTKMIISVWAIIVTETDTPTSRTCQIGFRCFGSAVRPLQHGQQHGQRRRWPRPPCSASSAARASQSLARRHLVPPLPRGGVARDVTLGCRAQLNALTPAARPVAPRPRPPLCVVGGPS